MWLFPRKCKNHQLKWIGFTEEGHSYEVWECKNCGKRFIKLHDGKLI